MRQLIKTSILFDETLLQLRTHRKTSGLELCTSRQHQILEDIWFPQGHLNSMKSPQTSWSSCGDFNYEPAMPKHLYEDKTTLASIISSDENSKSTTFENTFANSSMMKKMEKASNLKTNTLLQWTRQKMQNKEFSL
jgi:hypothetical protein